MSSAPTDSENWPNEFDSAGLALLTPEERRLFHQLTSRPLWEPQSGPQTAAFDSLADITGYGGAGGGGKTDLLLGLAILSHQRSIVFRREASQGAAMIDRAREILGNSGQFNANTGRWRLPNNRLIEFAGVKDPGNEQRFKGRPHDLVAFDEADLLLESQVRFLLGWLRTTTPGQRCRCVMAFNPPSSPEGRWIVNFFAPWVDKKHPKPAQPGELRWYVTLKSGREIEVPSGEPFDDDGRLLRPLSRTFIPARVCDNKYLAGSHYETVLDSLPEPLRSQLRDGDFGAGLLDDEWQVIPTEWVEAAMARWTPDGGDDVPLSAIGADVARGNPDVANRGDQTVLAKRHGVWWAKIESYPGNTTPDGPAVVLLIERAKGNSLGCLVNVDVIGIGASVFDGCRAKGWNCMAVNFAMNPKGATDSSGVLIMANVRAFAYWSMRELLDPANGYNAALPPDPELLGDLTAVRYLRRGGGILIRPKEEVRAEIGRSTDKGDSVVLSILMPPPGE